MDTTGSLLHRLTTIRVAARARRIVGRFIGRNIAHRLLAVVFLAMLTAGWIGGAVNMIAQRAEFPTVTSWKKLPARFETFLNDRLLGRSLLLNANAQLKLSILDVSPTPRVWVGSDGMLFYNHRTELPAICAGEAGEAQCFVHWSQLVRRRRDWCQTRGLPFHLLVVPDKQSVYPELLPPAIRNRHDNGVLERLVESWKLAPCIDVIDLRDHLRAAKATMQIYRLSDTHWTPYGCWRGYCRTVEALGLRPRPWNEFNLANWPFAGGDVWRFLGLSGPTPVEEYPCPRLSNSRAVKTDETVAIPEEDRLSHNRPAVWINAASKGPRVVLFCDSFADHLFQELLAQHCARLVIVPTYEMIQGIVETERPDVVICETVERSILATRPRWPGCP
jgi:alginate O-acetyltransferase complex protein AlgJ